MKRFLLFLLFSTTAVYGQPVRDDFNRAATSDISGSLKWNRLFGQSDPSASIQINPDGTISPINPLGTPANGGVWWDSALAGRIRLGAVLKKKSGTDGIPGFSIALMTDSSLESGDGYGFRIQENAATDAFGIVRITSNGTSSPSITPLVSGNLELAVGDTLLFDAYPDGRKTGTVRGAGGSVDSVSVTDTTTNPVSWKAWLVGTVFTDSLKMDDFILGTIPYTIVATAGGGGAISPPGAVAVDSGGNRTFTITPDVGYHIDSVVVDGTSLGAVTSHDFTNVTANHTIAAYFSIDVFTITASASAGGNISPSGGVAVDYGGSQSFTLTPTTGYHVDSIVVDGVNQGDSTSYDFTNVTANHTIAAYFSINIYTLTATVHGGGSISPSGTINANYGANQSFNLTPNTGYHIDSAVVDGVNQGAVASYDFLTVMANHTIDAYFSIDVFTITASASAGGSITPSGGVGVNYGSSQPFSITPDTGYHIDSVVADGTNLGAISSHTFTNVTAGHSITAYFSIDVFTITATASSGGSIIPFGGVSVNYGADRLFSMTPNTGSHIDSVVVDGVNMGVISSYEFTGVTANHTIMAYFSIDVFTITATADTGGSISPSGAVGVNYGANRTFTITPNVGYHTDSVVVDGSNLGVTGSHTFTNVTANHTIAAWFSIDVKTITAGAGAGGSISPTGTVNVDYGSNQSFTITPDTGHHVDSVVVDGTDEGPLTGRDFTNVTTDHTIDAYFSINVYTITATASAGGSISPSGGVDVSWGGNQSFSISADTGYHMDSVVVDGVNEGLITNRDFTNVTENHTITAYFSIDAFTITASAGPGGSISPSGSILLNYGANQSFTISPDTGYHVDSVVVDGTNEGAITSRNFTNVTANHTITAWFSIDIFTITATAGTGGSISPAGGVNVSYGANQSFTISPDTGYHVDSVVVDGINEGAITSRNFTNVTANHTITAYFSIDVFTITASVAGNGSISPSGAVNVNYGSGQAFSITPNTGYHIDSVVVDGVNEGAPANRNFTNVTANHTITAYFSITMYTISASATGGGSISPSGDIGVTYGSGQAFSITPNTGYHIDSVVVDGANEGALTARNFVNVTANHTIDAYFSIDVFTITASSVGNGSVSPAGSVNVNYGDNQQFVVTPDSGYHTDSVLVDGFDQGTGVNFIFSNVTGNHSIVAYFSINVYTISATASGGGSVSPPGDTDVNHGGSQSYVITPDTGYHIDSVVVDGLNEGAITGRNFTNVTTGHTIAAYFSIDVFTISATASAGGTISPSGDIDLNYGANQSFSIAPNTGFHIDSVVVDGVNEGAPANRNFTNVTANHTIAAYFSIDVFTITASAGAGGSISPSGAVNVNYGGTQPFSITPNTGFHIDSVVVNGTNEGAITSRNFTNVTANHTIAAYFSIDVFTITASAVGGGSISPPGSVDVNYGGAQAYAITPNTGYHIDSVVVDGVNEGAVTGRTFTNVTANHTIAAHFSIDVFTITATAGAGGTISPSGAIGMNYGSDTSFSITPNTGYHIDSVVVDGLNEGAITGRSFANVTANHTIDAYFSIDVFTITVGAAGGGSVSPTGAVNVNYGDNQAFVVTPDPGYHTDSVLVDGFDQGTGVNFLFSNVTANHTITAYFSINVYTITATGSAGGTISPPGGTNVNHGGSQSYTITPDTGYHVDSVVVDGVNEGAVTGRDFTNVTANHTIDAYFSIDVFSITATATVGGSISPSGTVDVSYGSGQSFTITPVTGYHLDSVMVDGVNQGAVTAYNFTNVTSNRTIAAFFTINDYTIVATAGTGGSISPSGAVSVIYGTDTSFAIAPNTGYHIDSVVVDGTDLGVLTSYDFTNITVSHSITAYFSLDTFAIAASAGPGGSISPSGTVVVKYGSDTSFAITPNTGYHIDSVVVDGTNVGAPSLYQFTGVTTARTIAAYFSIDMFTINATSSAGGSITPSGGITLAYGTSQSFSMLAETGTHLDSVLVDGVNQGTVPAFDFTNVTANHTIAAFFSVDVFGITVATVGNGSVSPSGVVNVNYGDSQALVVTPAIGHHTDSVLVDGFDQGNGVNFLFSNVTGDHTFTAYFSIDVFTVAATAAPGGSITPSGAVGVDYGTDRSFAITPDTGYHIDSVVVDGVNQGAVPAYNLTNVTANHTIDAYFSINVYTITSAANGGGGISPAGTENVNHGSTVNYTISPNTGYHIDSVVVDGANLGLVTAYSFMTVTTNHTITAYFSINVLTISATASAGGTISPSGSVDLTYGSAQGFTIAPDTGYHIDSVVVDNINRGAVTSYNFPNVTSSHNIHAYFSVNGYTITATASPGGQTNPTGTVVVTHGGSRSFTILPNASNHIDSVVVDGVNLGVITSYNFTNVTGNHTIAAWFSPTYFTITATADSGGTISPAGAVQVLEDADQGFTVVPSTGFLILDVLVDSVSVGSVSSYQFTGVSGPHTIRAVFVKLNYSVVASSSPGGTISPAGTVGVQYGDDTTFVMTPATGYHIDSVRVDGVNVGTPASYTFTNITVSHTIAVFYSINRYTITASSVGNGTVSPAGATMLTYGADQNYTFTPSTGFVVQDVRVDGVSVGAVPEYDFTNVSANHTIQVTFAIQKFTITATAGPNGSVSPAGVSEVNYGGSVTVFIMPTGGYYIEGVTVDSTPVGIVGSYAFNNVTRNHTISATFTSNAPPSAPRLLIPANNGVISTGSLSALYFSWVASTDGNPGDVLKYILTIYGPNVNFSTFEQIPATATLDLSGLAFIPDSIYRWTVRVSDGQMTVTSPDTFKFTVNTATAVREGWGVPAEYGLGQNYPNPFNPSTSIPFDLPERSEVTLRLYNMLGVEVLNPGGAKTLAAGSYRETVDFAGLPSGTYIYRLTAKGESGSVFQGVKKLLVIR